MVIVAQQLQEKCWEKNRNVCMSVIDLTKAYDTIALENNANDRLGWPRLVFHISFSPTILQDIPFRLHLRYSVSYKRTYSFSNHNWKIYTWKKWTNWVSTIWTSTAEYPNRIDELDESEEPKQDPQNAATVTSRAKLLSKRQRDLDTLLSIIARKVE